MPVNPFADLPTTADDEGFAQPVHGLFADLDAGLGCINLPDDFALAPSANQLSVIADWQSFAGYAPRPRDRVGDAAGRFAGRGSAWAATIRRRSRAPPPACRG